jgi:uncharacterized membrane protein
MDWRRWFRHSFALRRTLRRAFPPGTLDAIERAIDESELVHRGEIRFAIESSLEPGAALHGKAPRARALEVFAALGVWDTNENNGVLIYVLLADRDVEIVADRGFNDLVPREQWSAVCDHMEQEFRAGRFREGAVAGVQDVGRIVARHFPRRPGERDRDELPNRPALL